MSITTASATFTDHAPALVVYGLDGGGKPHASLFANADADLAEKAAGLMSMRAFRLAEPEHLAAVAGLPAGRVFASGKAFVPFVKKALYDRLTALGGAPTPKPISRPAAPLARPAKVKAVEGAKLAGVKAEEAEIATNLDSEDSSSPANRVDPFAVGTVVLAPELVMSWWEAIIVAVKGDAVTLKWRDFPEEPTFKRSRSQIAFLPDDYVLPV